jgi:mRNA-degrading endonuclease RelE of RelBE toxin-antitoxin system
VVDRQRGSGVRSILAYRKADLVDLDSRTCYGSRTMAWTVTLHEAAIENLRWFGKRTSQLLLKAALDRLRNDPLAKTRNMKTHRPNPVAQRELRMADKYRVLFNVDEEAEKVTIVVVGEKRGNMLLVEGKEFIEHHEDDHAE